MYSFVGLCIAVEGYAFLCRAMNLCLGLCIAVEGYV